VRETCHGREGGEKSKRGGEGGNKAFFFPPSVEKGGKGGNRAIRTSRSGSQGGKIKNHEEKRGGDPCTVVI